MNEHKSSMRASALRSAIADFARQIPPDIAGIVAVTNVMITDETAVVYVRAFGDVKEACMWLKNNVRLLTESIRRTLQLSRIPYFRFLPDTEAERLERLHELLTPRETTKPKKLVKKKSRATTAKKSS